MAYTPYGYLIASGVAVSDATNNYIQVADSDSLDITDELTVEGWFKWDGAQGSEGNAHYMVRKLNAYGLALDSYHEICGNVYVDGDYRGITSNMDMPTNVWTHIAMTYSSFLHQLKIYINGDLKATNTLSGLSTYQINASNDELRLGSFIGFTGCADEVRISNVIRYNSMLDVPYISDTNTVLLFHFDEESGSSVIDSSSNGNNGTFQISTLRMDGKYSNAVQIDNSRYYKVEDRNSLDITDELTVEGWFKWDGAQGPEGNAHYMVCKSNAYGLALDSYHEICGNVYVDGDYRGVTSNMDMPVNVWTHVAMTYSSSTHQLKIYVNGDLMATNTLSGLSTYQINASDDELRLGRDIFGGHIFTGYADEVCVSNTVKASFPMVN